MNDRQDPVHELVERAAAEYRTLSYRGPVPALERGRAASPWRALWPTTAAAASLLLVLLWPSTAPPPVKQPEPSFSYSVDFELRQPGPPASLSAAARAAREGIEGVRRPDFRMPPPPAAQRYRAG